MRFTESTPAPHSDVHGFRTIADIMRAFNPFTGKVYKEALQMSRLTLSDGVSMESAFVGAMLPYTPLHALLLAAIDRPVVCTSGNRASEPICVGNDEARVRLAAIADAFLVHDRPIVRPVNDSVVRGRTILRRARGYAPLPVGTIDPHACVLGMGARLKSTVTLGHRGTLVASQHIGDLDAWETRQLLATTIDAARRAARRPILGKAPPRAASPRARRGVHGGVRARRSRARSRVGRRRSRRRRIDLGWRFRRDAFEGVLGDLRAGVDPPIIARRFHETLVDMGTRVAIESKLPRVVLCGGCFQNELLASGLRARLEARGLDVYAPRAIPANDGGISFGQAWLAAKISARDRSSRG